MKKSKIITLSLITASLASCQKKAVEEHQKKVYMRTDTTAPYARAYGFQQDHETSRQHSSGGMGHAILWYYAFRPYGYYDSYRGVYAHYGHYNSAIGTHANVGTNPTKGTVMRGGFGSSGRFVSS
jgi:hypothetical protein